MDVRGTPVLHDMVPQSPGYFGCPLNNGRPSRAPVKIFLYVIIFLYAALLVLPFVMLSYYKLDRPCKKTIFGTPPPLLPKAKRPQIFGEPPFLFFPPLLLRILPFLIFLQVRAGFLRSC